MGYGNQWFNATYEDSPNNPYSEVNESFLILTFFRVLITTIYGVNILN